ncbi:hypothetical protein EXIGLDRAFT_730344 [Exidia glandulosa HHB12029]|uniref:Uncharacterized protein n=1 Tax=Exidia glandulosa HHB12029 TaxID=1314781 RepID=A0A165C7U7_EXIGL|nr:hypothetical protein EXIGLDRAFT_730344 [Exidia glandulosa HHB12029]
MDAVEEPMMTTELIELGDVVVVSLDPVASVAPLDDAEATAAASEIPRRKFLAIVNVYTDFDVRVPGYVTPLALKFFAVGRGLPEVAGASVPLAAGLAHPNSRAPVELALPSQFSDCYVHTLQVFKARVQRIYPANPSGIRLSRQQHGALDKALSEDLFAQAEPRQHQIGEPSRIPLEDEDPDEPYVYDLESEFFVSDAVAPGDQPRDRVDDYQTQPAAIPHANDEAAAPSPHTAPSAAQPVASDQAPAPQTGDLRAANLAQHNAALMQDEDDPTADFPDMVISLDLWLDLGTADEIGSPRELIDHIARLNKIEHDWAHRKMRAILAAQPGTSNWLANVAPGGLVAEGDANRDGDPAVVPEDVLSPEDAIEHRMEKDKVAGDGDSDTRSRTSSISPAPAGPRSPAGRLVSLLRTFSTRIRTGLKSWLCLAPKTAD